MSRKDHRDKTVSSYAVTNIEKLNLPDLKRECIIRGLPFEMVGAMSILNLQSWFLHHYDNPRDKKLLDRYDEWVEAELKGRGADPLLYSQTFRLGTAIENNEAGDTKQRRLRSRIPKFREKKKRTIDGLYVGTKKAYTYELQKQGYSKSETIQKVLEQFKDAKEKSIGIWFNKAKRSGKA